MAKTEVIAWGDWKARTYKGANAPQIIGIANDEETFKRISKKARKAVSVALVVAAGVTFALHGIDAATLASLGIPVDAVATVAQNATPDFAAQLSKVTKPIRDIIFGFGHEIYFVMMAWGGIEALIGKSQQGFARMKSSTAAYVILYWIPYIVDIVNSAVPH